MIVAITCLLLFVGFIVLIVEIGRDCQKHNDGGEG